MIRQRPHDDGPAMFCALAGLAVLLLLSLPAPGSAQESAVSKEFGVAAKRPVLQAACKNCPWGQLGEILKTIMAPAYDVAICYSCSGENSVRFVSKRLVSAEISDRQFAQGTYTRPDAAIDFGITQAERVRWGYEGGDTYKNPITIPLPARPRR